MQYTVMYNERVTKVYDGFINYDGYNAVPADKWIVLVTVEDSVEEWLCEPNPTALAELHKYYTDRCEPFGRFLVCKPLLAKEKGQ